MQDDHAFAPSMPAILPRPASCCRTAELHDPGQNYRCQTGLDDLLRINRRQQTQYLGMEEKHAPVTPGRCKARERMPSAIQENKAAKMRAAYMHTVHASGFTEPPDDDMLPAVRRIVQQAARLAVSQPAVQLNGSSTKY